MRSQAASLPVWHYSIVAVGRQRLLGRPYVTVPVGILIKLPTASYLYLTDKWSLAEARMSIEGEFSKFKHQRKMAEEIAKSIKGDALARLELLSLFHVGRARLVQVGPFNPETTPQLLMEKYVGTAR